MRIELEYRGEDNRWHWRVYDEVTTSERAGIRERRLVREGFARTEAEADNAAGLAVLEYRSRKVVEL